MPALTKEQIQSMTLDQLYAFANDRYWDGYLPPVDISWNGNFATKLGTARPLVTTGTDRCAIHIAELLRNDPEKLLNVIVHEQIHIWQFAKYYETGQARYLDHKDLKRKKGHRKGHGELFFAQSERLERDFPEIAISVRDDFDPVESNVEIDQRYGALLNVRDSRGTGHRVVFWCEKDFHDNLHILAESLGEIFGPTLVERLTPFVTKNPRIAQAAKLTNKGLPRKGAANFSHIEEFVESILDHEETDVLWDQAIDIKSHVPDIDPRLAAAPVSTKIHLGHTLDLYTSVTVNSARGFLKDRLDAESARQVIAGEHPKVQQKEADFIYNEWLKAKPEDFFRKNSLLSELANQTTRLMTRQGIGPNQVRNSFISSWRNLGGPVRFPWKDATAHYEKALIREMRKRVKDPSVRAQNTRRILSITEEAFESEPKAITPEDALRMVTRDNSARSREVFGWEAVRIFKSFGMDSAGIAEKSRQQWDKCTLEDSFEGKQGKQILDTLSSLVRQSMNFSAIRHPQDTVNILRDHAKSFVGRGLATPDEGVHKIIDHFEQAYLSRAAAGRPGEGDSNHVAEEVATILRETLAEDPKNTSNIKPGQGPAPSA